MTLFKSTYYRLASLLPEKFIKSICPVKTLFPYQHTVSDEDLVHIKHLYSYKNVVQFKQDLDTLLKSYKPVSVVEINTAIMNNGVLPPNTFLLSFDDGFREVYDVISPILIEKGVPAIFFINPAFLDNHELFYRCKISLIIEELYVRKKDQLLLKDCAAIFKQNERISFDELLTTIKTVTNLNMHLLDELEKRLTLSFSNFLSLKKPFLTTSQVKELNDKGFSIGAHSWDHPYYHLLTLEDQLKQTTDSCLFINDLCKGPISLFSFPFSDRDISQDFFDEMNNSGSKVDIYFGTQNNKNESGNRVIHRFNAERPEINLSSQIKGLLLMLSIQRFKADHFFNRMKVNKL